MARRTKQENEKRKQWAKDEFLLKDLTGKEIAKKVGITQKTFSKWRAEGKWDDLKAATIISKPQQLALLYEQINELNTSIKSRPQGERFADSKEASTLINLTKSIQYLEGDLGLSEIINVSVPLLKYIKSINYEDSQKLKGYFDSFISDKISGNN